MFFISYLASRALFQSDFCPGNSTTASIPFISWTSLWSHLLFIPLSPMSYTKHYGLGQSRHFFGCSGPTERVINTVRGCTAPSRFVSGRLISMTHPLTTILLRTDYFILFSPSFLLVLMTQKNIKLSFFSRETKWLDSISKSSLKHKAVSFRGKRCLSALWHHLAPSCLIACELHLCLKSFVLASLHT